MTINSTLWMTASEANAECQRNEKFRDAIRAHKLKLSPNYGDKRDYRKIDIFVYGQYVCSTTWARTCREAIAKYMERNPGHEAASIKARYDTET